MAVIVVIGRRFGVKSVKNVPQSPDSMLYSVILNMRHRKIIDTSTAPSLESGIFGVLFTLSQEKNQQHIYYHWILLKILLDAWQLFTTIVSPELGWDIDPDSMAWKCVSVLSFGWLKDLGYRWYVAVLYSMAGLLAVNLVLCVWVAWSFKEQKFDYVWPIKVVRGFSYVFLQVFDITSLNFLQLGISCNYVGPAKPHLHLSMFPSHSCSSSPHIIHALVSGLLLLLFVVVAMLVNMSEVEVNPTSKTPQALGHSGAEVTAFGIKALMTLVGVFLGWPKVAAIAYCLLAAWLAWEYLRWVPHLLTWVNCLKGGVALAMFGVAVMQLAIALQPRGLERPGGMARTVTLAMAVGLGPLFLLGALATFLRTKLFTAAVVKAFKNADYEAVKPQDVYHFAHPRDVEVAARCARVWTDLYTLEKTAMHRAEEIIKAGVALFPDSAFVAAVYANFMLDMLGFSQTGARQLESVRKLNPSLMCRFMLFVRHQQATQKAASSNVGKGGNMDLLGYVEYQRKQRMVLRHHKDALQAMAYFWFLETIKQDPWTAAQLRAPCRSLKLQRDNREHRTRRYHAAAERLEENKDEDGQGPALPDGTPISRMDDVEKGVLVVNAFGDIQVANRKLHNMFGYKKGELDGKNVTVLMPPHEAKRHPGLMRRYIDSGDKAAPYFKHPVLAVHRERVAFTVRIAVSRASGLGEDSVFIGLIEALPAEPGMGRVWVTPEGVIVCCDPGFVTCFGCGMEGGRAREGGSLGWCMGGWREQESRTRGRDGGVVAVEEEEAERSLGNGNCRFIRLLATADDYGSNTTTSTDEHNRCSVLHKYDFAKEVRIAVRSDMTKSNIYEVRLKLISDEPQLLMVVERKGAIRHMSGDLAKVLGVGIGDGPQSGQQGGGGDGGGANPNTDYNIAEDHVMVELMSEGMQRSLDDFLPTPWKVMHYKYRKYVKDGAPNLSGLWGCRAVPEEGSNAVGPTMQLVGAHGKPVYVHVAVSSRDNQGEISHVVRMTRSSKEQAIAERRLRLRITEDGVVQEVLAPGGFQAAGATAAAAQGASADLFGFPPEQLLGCQLWDCVFLTSQQAIGGGIRPSQAQVPPPPRSSQQQTLDLIMEAEAAVQGRGAACSFGSGGVVSNDGGGNAAPRQWAGVAAGWTESQSLNLGMLDTMITNTLQSPGVSWRVNVVPPSASVEAATMGSQERAAAVLARRTKQAVLRLDVALPPPGQLTTHGSGRLLVHAELWATEAVTGVLEIDGSGKITGVLEEEPGQSPVGLLTDSGVAKKSALKATSRKGKIVDKASTVGPVHYLEGFHRDHRPLHLAVQVVGKPGPGNPVIAVIRFASGKAGGKRGFLRPGPGPAAAAAPGAQVQRSHVQLSFSGNEATLALPPSGPSMQLLPPAAVGTIGSGGLPLKMREATCSRSGALGAQQITATRAVLPGSTAALAAAATCAISSQPPQLPGSTTAGPAPVAAVATATVAGPGASTTGTSSPLKPTSPPVLSPSKRALLSASPRGAPNLGGGDMVDGELSAVVQQLDGTKVMANLQPKASAEQLLSRAGGDAEERRQATGEPGGLTLAGAMRALQQGEAGNERSVRSDVGCYSRYLISAGISPTHARHVRGQFRLILAASRICHLPATNCLLQLLPIIYQLAASQGVDKWVTSGGQFFKNRAQSLCEADLDAEEEEEDEDEYGSFGATSRATSSHWMSPTGSRNFMDPALEEQQCGGGGGGGEVGAFGQQHHHQHHQHHQHHRQGGANPQGGGGGGGGGWGSWGSGALPPHARLPGGGPGDGGFASPEGLTGEQDGVAAGALGSWGQVAESGVDVAKPRATEDIPDDRSDGGESALSGMSGMSGLSDGETPADFKRGKRYRKLVKLMDSPEAQKTVVRMKIHTALTLLTAGVIHIVCFALVISAVKPPFSAAHLGASEFLTARYFTSLLFLSSIKQKQREALRNMADAGHAQVHLQRTLANSIMEDCQEFRSINNIILGKLGRNTEDLYYSREVTVWSGINATTKLPYYENMTLWDMVTRIFVSAKTVFQNHADWSRQGSNVSATAAGSFLLNSGQALIPGMNKMVNVLLDVAIWRTKTVNMLQLAFLILEGFLVTFISAIILVHILRSACDQRYQLYETFLKIPVGLTRALASQTTHLLDDDESDDEEDEEASQNLDNTDEGHPSAQKRKAFFDESGVGGGANGQDHGSPERGGGGGGGGGGRGTTASDPLGKPYGSGAGLRSRQRRGSVGPGGNSKFAFRQNDDSTRGLLLRTVSNRMRGGGGGGGGVGCPPSPGYHQPLPSPGMGGLSNRYSLSAMASGRESSDHRPRQSWFGRVFGKFWRANVVSPLPSPVPSPDAHDGPARRTLERNSRIPQATLIFIGCYSLLIILFYSVSYSILLGVNDMVAFQGVADHHTERTYRTVFYAQELVAEEDMVLVPRRVQDLKGAAIALRDAYYTLRMGAYAWTALGRGVEQFPHVRSRGTIRETSAMFQIFYADNQCLRLPEHLPCPPLTDRFYQIVRSGVDGMLTQLLLEVKGLADYAEAALVTNASKPDLKSSQWEFIYRVGTVDLFDGNQRIVVQHVEDIRKVFNAVVVLHVVLFLLLLGVFLAFLMVIYLPLLRRMAKEKRRIAEMMSQLPTELDVMRLVSTALMGPKPKLQHSYRRRSQVDAAATSTRRITVGMSNVEVEPGSGALVGGAVSGAMVLSGDGGLGGFGSGGSGSAKIGDVPVGSKAYQAWKDILNRATNVSSITKSEPSMATAKRSSGRPTQVKQQKLPEEQSADEW
ncbi:hypothetical protein VOLCADRAFT_87875 [Volvox carteri f. nagariensis]|uniref:PAS domain-containing protein n=1 Tax=Volvox carteri f. nagariensis TaxID=3068 RepID=D8TMG9_VOLCA|nr:uncharacterized protein VOLCADRAFT_87875 [Volvox carteri f. nagariensis]EFJ51253.1 hypothetical protein VOLCADRAFT_87875 [Volvox carteri f. nagariensis]|eukprot:XP_002947720.1 hypothetical protein VOLCADRAFT_87875 [Volvox carteri f. nagariensis]